MFRPGLLYVYGALQATDGYRSTAVRPIDLPDEYFIHRAAHRDFRGVHRAGFRGGTLDERELFVGAGLLHGVGVGHTVLLNVGLVVLGETDETAADQRAGDY